MKRKYTPAILKPGVTPGDEPGMSVEGAFGFVGQGRHPGEVSIAVSPYSKERMELGDEIRIYPLPKQK